MEMSTTEISEKPKELACLTRLLSEFLITAQKFPTFYVDNVSELKLAENPEYHHRSKHVEHFFCEENIL